MADTAYRMDARELAFVLFERYQIHENLFPHEPYSKNLSLELAVQLLRDAQAFAFKLGQFYQASDREACSLEADGRVRLPEAYAELWEEYQANFGILALRKRLGVDDGDPLQPVMPAILNNFIMEMFVGANPCFMIYGGFTISAAKLINTQGSSHQKNLFLADMVAGRTDACFCVTEPDAGSDVIAVKTVGSLQADGSYQLRGEKIFISAGMHQLTKNTVYFVVGRTEDTVADSPQLSCFLVPKLWFNETTGQWEDNHVECLKVEHKMGLKACANTHLAFGRNGTTRAFVLGDRPRMGLTQLLPLMKDARMSTALFGIGLASSAYMHSVEYAKKRVQGRMIQQAYDVKAPRVPIIAHTDVQRMLLDMRARVEGCRGLVGMLSEHTSRLHLLEHTPAADVAEKQRHERMIETLTPVLKAYVSDEAWRICETAIQVHGGVGYCSDLPVEQYARDVKILSIWEGTNFIQAQDLLRDKLGYGRNSLAMRWIEEDLKTFLRRKSEYPALSRMFEAVEHAWGAILEALALINTMSKELGLAATSQYFTRFLKMFGEVCSAWKLLESACVAHDRLVGGTSETPFYEGKIVTAEYFAFNLLPAVHSTVEIFRDRARSHFTVSPDHFPSVNDEFTAVAP